MNSAALCEVMQSLAQVQTVGCSVTTILMVFTRKDGEFFNGYVRLTEGNHIEGDQT